METLQFDKGIAVELNLLITLPRGVEHVVVDNVRLAANTVHSSITLHQATGIPRRVVVDNHVRTMQVDALGQHITCDDNIVFVLLHSAVVGIEVGGNIVALLIAVGGSHF